MRVGSLFAGIGGFDLAAQRSGLEVAWVSEVDSHANRVLAHRFPDIPNHGDIHDITPDTLGSGATIDVLTGGFPCQDYSHAGTRRGLAGDRGALWWQYHRLIRLLRPTWVVGENVAGLISSRGGRDFETIIRSLTDIGYGMVWSVLDAQYFGVAQRRRRVFLVGHLGGEPRPEVLALGEGAFGHPPPSRTPRQEVAGSLAPGSQSGGPRSTDLDGHGAYVVEPETGQGADLKARETEISPSLTEADGKLHERGVRIVGPEVSSPITATYGKGPSDGGEGRTVIAVEASRRDAVRIQDEEVSNTLQAFAGTGGNNTPMVVAANQRDEVRDLGDLAVSLDANPGMKQQTFITDEVAGVDGYNQTEYEGVHHPLRTATGDGDPTVRTGEIIRRLTPLECERLQGFPDGWTAIEGNPDTQRYRQLGNAVAVPVAEWILRRLADA